MLDEPGRHELDRLWREFDFITGAPMRQYSSYLWFERAESRFLRDPEFDFIRAEDRDAASEAKIQRLAELYLAKARRIEAGEPAIKAVADQFEIISASIRRVERDRAEAEPRHVEALQAFAERAYRRPLSKEERDGVADFYRTLRASRTGWATRTRSATRSSACSCRPTSATASTSRSGRGRPAAVRFRPGEPPELFPLVEHARRRR